MVDDRSTDRSLDIAREFAARDERILVYENKKNLGDYENRNRAALLASGKYIKYLDADDVIYPHSLEIMIEAMEESDAAALALSSNVIDPQCPYPHEYTPAEVYKSHFLGSSLLGVGPSAAIIRRESFEAVGGFSGKQFVGDSELWLKLAGKWRIVTLPPALVWWRQHEGQQINLEQTRPEVLDIRYQMEKGFLESTDVMSDVDKLQGLRRLRQHHARRILSIALRQGKFAVARMLFRRSGFSFAELLSGFGRYAN